MEARVVGLFCEDAREEKSGQFSLIGLLPDNVVLSGSAEDFENPKTHAVMPKLALYIRINLGIDETVGPISVNLKLPDEQELALGAVDQSVVATAQQNARKKGLPAAGILHHAVMHGFRVPRPGMLYAVVHIGEETHECAFLRFAFEEAQETGAS
jgi:hypothetical protein